MGEKMIRKFLLMGLMTLSFDAVVASIPLDSINSTFSSADIFSAQQLANNGVSTSDRPRKKQDVFHRIGSFFTRYFRDFNETDTSYIEPQHYNYAFMLQNTNTYETYKLESKSGQSISFAPQPTYRVGPYFGWRWIFLGYTFDISHLSNDHKKTEIDLSLYSNLVSLDLYYRKTGTDYKIREVELSGDIDTKSLKGLPFDGLNVGIIGFDLYYIFNHKRFSYPAAFSQSTVQRKSCGSPLVGIGYTRHSISFDFDRLQEVVDANLQEAQTNPDATKLDDGLRFDKVRYANIAISGGYAYNWVPARNWLVASSLSLALGYKYSSGDLQRDATTSLRDFSFKNLAFDGTWRFGIVWNNTKWFAGMSTILHSYSYRKSRFSTNNRFGSLNFYVGFNFVRKRGHTPPQ